MFVQMAGQPGAGKTTLSRALVPYTGATVLDLDVVKTALLDDGVPWDDAGRTAYGVLFALAEDMLRADRPVIVDSPSRWEIIPRRGQEIARSLGVPYVMIECLCPDLDEVSRRLTTRVRRRSQYQGLMQSAPESSETFSSAADAEAVSRTLGPDGGWLTVDMTRPVEDCVADVLTHLEGISLARPAP